MTNTLSLFLMSVTAVSSEICTQLSSRISRSTHLFGFTGTPIFAVNASKSGNPQFHTTEQTFCDQLHIYTIVDAINDKNVLPFHVDYYKTMGVDEEMIDEQVWDINREKAYMAPSGSNLSLGTSWNTSILCGIAKRNGITHFTELYRSLHKNFLFWCCQTGTPVLFAIDAENYS